MGFRDRNRNSQREQSRDGIRIGRTYRDANLVADGDCDSNSDGYGLAHGDSYDYANRYGNPNGHRDLDGYDDRECY